ncbi:MAG: V-type ATP synthase subunit F [Oscillospiraceae bacterium]|nr:V-type ATP synthase subunit F [Oscillospiraceae bacterium]
MISDNIDAIVGLRLAGIVGVILHTEKEVKETIEKIKNDQTVAAVLITEKLMLLCGSWIYKIKLEAKNFLIVQIPDRHGTSGIGEVISKYIKDVIGIKI